MTKIIHFKRKKNTKFVTMKKIILTVAIFSMLFSSCKDDDKKPEPQKRTFMIEYSLIGNGQDFVFDKDVITLPSSNEITSTRVSYLLSKFYVITENGDKLQFNDTYGYIDISDKENMVLLSDIPEGKYKGFGFTLGLDSVINHGDPSSYAIDHPLNAVKNGLHWTWATGYVFISVEGGLPQTNEGYSYHLSGTDKPVAYEYLKDFQISENNIKAKVSFDLAELFKSPNTIDVYSDGKAVHEVNTPLGDKMFENLANAFQLIEIK